jgi:hypothetical protein
VIPAEEDDGSGATPARVMAEEVERAVLSEELGARDRRDAGFERP